MQSHHPRLTKASGFSLFELMIAMTITLVLMGLASTLLAKSFNIRARENQRSAAIADSQRGLNMMTREIATSGFALTSNGIVEADSNATSIRVRANLNAGSGETTSNSVTDRDEDVKYLLYTDSGHSYIVRLDVNTAAQEMILANRVDTLTIKYFADKVSYAAENCEITNVVNTAGNSVSEVTAKSAAKYIVISLCVSLPAVGVANTSGYQPESRVQLVSDIALRNSDLVNY
jgi:prepilin-type N-terminal cleavage/methylation domain-containing protein